MAAGAVTAAEATAKAVTAANSSAATNAAYSSAAGATPKAATAECAGTSNGTRAMHSGGQRRALATPMTLLVGSHGVRLSVVVVHVGTAAGIEEAVVPTAIGIIECAGPAIGPAQIVVRRARVIGIGINGCSGAEGDALGARRDGQSAGSEKKCKFSAHVEITFL